NAAALLTGTQTADTTAAGSFTVSYPAKPGAAGYEIHGPCGKTTVIGMTSGTLPMKMGCLVSPMDLVVIALDSMGYPTAYAEKNNVTFTSGGSTTVTDTWHALASVAATYSNAPSFCASSTDPNYPCTIEIDRFVPDVHGFLALNSNSIA